jgi:tetratricopeptide (TPR) repeat protein
MALSALLAERRLRQFEARHGACLVEFAAAAALPVVLDARFVHLLRINFFLNADDPLPWTAESDLLFSSLCTDLGDGLYEIEPTTRTLLLERLAAEHGSGRVRDVASLLWAYLHQRPAPWAHEPDLERAQELTALQFLDPEECKRWVARAETAISGEAKAARRWFVAMQRKLDAGRSAAEWDILVQRRAFIEELYRECKTLSSQPATSGINSPLLVELANAREELRIFAGRLDEIRGQSGEWLLRNRTTIDALQVRVKKARFLALYAALQTLGFADQMAAARAAGWGSSSSPGLIIVGSPGYGHSWLATRLLEEFSRNAPPPVVLSHGDDAHLGDSTYFVRLPKLTRFTHNELSHWIQHHRYLFSSGALADLSIEEIVIALDGVPELVFGRLCGLLGLDLESVEQRFHRFDPHIVDQLASRRERTPWPRFNGRSVLVAGTGTHRLSESEQLVSEALGRALARAGFGLVCGGWPGVDHLVARSYVATTQSLDGTNGYLVQIVKPGEVPDFAGGETVESPEVDDPHTSLDRAAAVIVIGGLKWTQLIFKQAVASGKKIFPIAATGGVAAKAFRQLTADEKGLLSGLDQLITPANADSLAEQVVALISNSLTGAAQPRSNHNDERRFLEESRALYREAGNSQGEANCNFRLGDLALARSEHDEAHQLYGKALIIYRQASDAQGEANCDLRLGSLALYRSKHSRARRFFEEGRSIYQRTGDVLGEANCLMGLGDVAQSRSEPDEARRIFEEARALYQREGAVQGEADCIRSLGDVALGRSRHDEARLLYGEARDLYKRVDDMLGQANCLKGIGDIALARSEHDEAGRLYDDALRLYRLVGSALGEANCLRNFGDIARHRSQHDEARRLFTEARALYRRVGDTLGEANCIRSLGDVGLYLSEYEEARRLYDESLLLYRRISDMRGEANCTQSLGNIALARSEHEKARRLYGKARALHRRAGDTRGEANCIYRLGDLALARADYKEASSLCNESLALYRRIGDVLGEANCFQSLGQISEKLSDHLAATKQYQAALSIYTNISDLYSSGNVHRRLAQLATDVKERHSHALAARELWEKIGRTDLVAEVDSEFGSIVVPTEVDPDRSAPQDRESPVPTVVVDTDVLLEIYSCHDIEDTFNPRFDKIGRAALQDPSVKHRFDRVRESILLAIYLNKTSAVVFIHNSEFIRLLTTRVPPASVSGRSWRTDFTTFVIHFVSDILLPIWSKGPFGTTTPGTEVGGNVDRVLLKVAKEHAIPLITNAGNRPSGVNKVKLRALAQAEGVQVYTPAEFYRGKMDESEEIDSFLRRFVQEGREHLMRREKEFGSDDSVGFMDLLLGYYRYVLLKEYERADVSLVLPSPSGNLVGRASFR